MPRLLARRSTLLAVLWAHYRILLDRPDNASRAGRNARDLVFNRLTSAKTIVVQTQRTDLHGRYVMHLFYSDEEISKTQCVEQGTYLNEELVTAGHAIVVSLEGSRIKAQ